MGHQAVQTIGRTQKGWQQCRVALSEAHTVQVRVKPEQPLAEKAFLCLQYLTPNRAYLEGVDSIRAESEPETQLWAE